MDKQQQLDWKQTVVAHYPTFENYVRNIKGHTSCPPISEIMLWYEYVEFMNDINNKEKRG